MIQISGCNLSAVDLYSEFEARPGLIPVHIDVNRRQIVWADLENFHCYSGTFGECLQSSISIRRSALDTFTSNLHILDSFAKTQGSLAPTGFIFHAGRCGSTLLAQILARSRANMVFGEAQPHNQIWGRFAAGVPRDEELEVTAFRNLLLAMGRRRLPSYSAHLIKFTSFNLLEFERIRRAFPGVPALFLFREPVASLDSYYRAKPAWMNSGIRQTPRTPESALETFFRKALSITDENFRCLEYWHLTPSSIPRILEFFHLQASPRDLRLMADAFHWDSKSGAISLPFRQRPDSSRRWDLLPTDLSRLEELYIRLKSWKSLLAADSVGH